MSNSPPIVSWPQHPISSSLSSASSTGSTTTSNPFTLIPSLLAQPNPDVPSILAHLETLKSKMASSTALIAKQRTALLRAALLDKPAPSPDLTILNARIIHLEKHLQIQTRTTTRYKTSLQTTRTELATLRRDVAALPVSKQPKRRSGSREKRRTPPTSPKAAPKSPPATARPPRPPAVTLRPACLADTAALATLWSSCYYDQQGVHSLPQSFLDQRMPHSFLTRTTPRIPHTTLACTTTAIVGMYTLAGAEIEQFYVAETARGVGVGGRLMEHAEARLGMEFEEGELYVLPGNDRAVQFYEKCGWGWKGEVRHCVEVQGGEVELQLMKFGKLLQAPEAPKQQNARSDHVLPAAPSEEPATANLQSESGKEHVASDSRVLGSAFLRPAAPSEEPATFEITANLQNEAGEELAFSYSSKGSLELNLQWSDDVMKSEEMLRGVEKSMEFHTVTGDPK